MMKVNSKQVFAGVSLIGCLVLLLVHVFVVMKINSMTDEINRSNVELKNRVNTLEGYHDNMEKNQAEIAQMQEGMEIILSEYPADALEEDAVMLAVNMQEGNEIRYDVINIAEPEVLYSIPEETVLAANVETLTKPIEFVERRVTYNNDINYTSLKNCIAAIYECDNRVAISNVSYSNNDDALEGNIDVSFYSVTGTDKKYVKPDISRYLAGKSDLFSFTGSEGVVVEEEQETEEE